MLGHRGSEERLHISSRDVGRLEGLLVQLQGALACWQLSYIRVTHVPSGEATFFPCDTWLDSGSLAGSLAEQAEALLRPGRCVVANCWVRGRHVWQKRSVCRAVFRAVQQHRRLAKARLCCRPGMCPVSQNNCEIICHSPALQYALAPQAAPFSDNIAVESGFDSQLSECAMWQGAIKGVHPHLMHQ